MADSRDKGILGAKIGDKILDRKSKKVGTVKRLGTSGNEDLVYIDFGGGLRKVNEMEDAQTTGRYIFKKDAKEEDFENEWEEETDESLSINEALETLRHMDEDEGEQKGKFIYMDRNREGEGISFSEDRPSGYSLSIINFTNKKPGVYLLRWDDEGLRATSTGCSSIEDLRNKLILAVNKTLKKYPEDELNKYNSKDGWGEMEFDFKAPVDHIYFWTAQTPEEAVDRYLEGIKDSGPADGDSVQGLKFVDTQKVDWEKQTYQDDFPYKEFKDED